MDDKLHQTGRDTPVNDDAYNPLRDAQERSAVRWVELPGFGDGSPWRARLRRLSLLAMAQAGRIPNTLLGAVSDLYQSGVVKSGGIKVTAEVMIAIAAESLAEPTMAQLTEAGVTLTDEQLTAIYLYAQRGAEALRPFRRLAGLPGDGANG